MVIGGTTSLMENTLYRQLGVCFISPTLDLTYLVILE